MCRAVRHGGRVGRLRVERQQAGMGQALGQRARGRRGRQRAVDRSVARQGLPARDERVTLDDRQHDKGSPL